MVFQKKKYLKVCFCELIFNFRYRLCPIVLKDVSNPDLSTSILGEKLNFPVCVAATAMNKMAHTLGEIAVAKSNFHVPFICFFLPRDLYNNNNNNNNNNKQVSTLLRQLITSKMWLHQSNSKTKSVK